MEELGNNLIWIDEAFSKDYIDELEAACCLTEGQNNVYFGDRVSGYSIEHEIYPILRRNYKIITTWNFPRQSLFGFINKAIAKNLQNFRRKFLLKKCNKLFLSMLPNDQGRFISDYPYISGELDLMVKNEDTDSIEKSEPESLVEKEAPWVISARKIYSELGLNKSNLSREQRAGKVVIEMRKRFIAGEEGMTKKGGKEVPAELTILRHALANLK